MADERGVLEPNFVEEVLPKIVGQRIVDYALAEVEEPEDGYYHEELLLRLENGQELVVRSRSLESDGEELYTAAEGAEFSALEIEVGEADAAVWEDD